MTKKFSNYVRGEGTVPDGEGVEGLKKKATAQPRVGRRLPCGVGPAEDARVLGRSLQTVRPEGEYCGI